jgi:hypothetical protein
MTCAEFQRELPDFLEEGGGSELQAHLNVCPICSELVASLESIVKEARMLQASVEPSPRVWNSIEIVLRQEGLIRRPQAAGQRSILRSLTRRWGVAAWLVPAAAMLLVGSAFFLYQRPGRSHQIADNSHVLPPGVRVMSVPPISGNGSDPSDEQLLQEVSARAPLMRAAYESNLRDVNAYIRDAQDSVNANPNDEEAQQALMDAYGQKSMIYEMALDRSLQ